MVQQSFGGEHTNHKLEIIEHYLKLYSTALKNQPFDRIYIDAFAGTGEVPQKSHTHNASLLFESYENEEQAVIKGSAQRAMDLKNPFKRYIFIETKRSNIKELQERFSKHARFARCEFKQKDANIALQEICENTDWKENRAVVFLDPFGNHVAWDTIETLAATKAIDLWYLFPSGNGVFRQVSKEGEIHKTHIASIDKLYGNTNWQNLFIKREFIEDLFGGNEKVSRNVTVSSATELMIYQMKQVFKGGVLDQWVSLGKNKGYPEFSLIFAWANPSESACRLARILGKQVLKVSED